MKNTSIKQTIKSKMSTLAAMYVKAMGTYGEALLVLAVWLARKGIRLARQKRKKHHID